MLKSAIFIPELNEVTKILPYDKDTRLFEQKLILLAYGKVDSEHIHRIELRNTKDFNNEKNSAVWWY